MKKSLFKFFFAAFSGLIFSVLLANPAHLINLKYLGISDNFPLFIALLGFFIGSIFGLGIVSGRIQFATACAIYSMMAALTLGFGIQSTELGTNFGSLDIAGKMLFGLIAVSGVSGYFIGLSIEISLESQPVSPMMPFILMMLSVLTLFMHGHEFMASITLAYALHWALYRFNLCQGKGNLGRYFLMLWFCWPLFVSCTYSQLWMLNNNSGHHAFDEFEVARVIAVVLCCLTFLSDVVVAIFFRGTTTNWNFLKSLATFLFVSFCHLLGIFFGFSLLSAYI